MPRGPLLLALLLALLLSLACDKGGPLANLDASWSIAPAASSTLVTSTPDAGPRDAGRMMPPRPVPTTSPTVLITMPLETQLQAIQYMAAMQAPQPGDAPADPDYGKTIADALRPLGKPDVISSGRLVEVKMERGCDATLPRQSIARYTGATLGVLLAHGMLVVRCSDHQVQCLQSTRDADDVLCTRK
jgi:hypothetical protein